MGTRTKCNALLTELSSSLNLENKLGLDVHRRADYPNMVMGKDRIQVLPAALERSTKL